MNSNSHFIFHLISLTQRKQSLEEGNFISELIRRIICCTYKFRFACLIISFFCPSTAVSISLNQHSWRYDYPYCTPRLHQQKLPVVSQTAQRSEQHLSGVEGVSGGCRAVRALLKFTFSQFQERL